MPLYLSGPVTNKPCIFSFPGGGKKKGHTRVWSSEVEGVRVLLGILSNEMCQEGGVHRVGVEGAIEAEGRR